MELTFEQSLSRLASQKRSEILVENGGIDKPSPFLKWVGGKRSIIEELKKRIPSKFGDYFESFVGGGALFFEIQPQKAHISDSNLDLTITYKVVQKDPGKLIKLLKKHQKNHSESYYYKIRSQHQSNDPIATAARLIYLNKTCYNGLWRVNRKGEFNVPIGSYSNPNICQENNIRACSKALQNTVIENKNYLNIDPKPGDFSYFDPPYHPITNTSFTAYSRPDFTENDQRQLANFCTHLHKKGIFVMVSNSNTNFILNLYKASHFKIAIVNAPRMVNCKGNERNTVKEVLITNY